MKITIKKESAVPIRDQLVEQIALQIASGTLGGQEKLPSIRALADRLGIHYSTVTAAYNHLAEVGLLEIRQGSGVRVAGRARSENAKIELDKLVQDFLGSMCDQGYSLQDLRQCIEWLDNRKPVRRLVVVDANRDFHKLLLAELRPHFEIPVELYTVDEFRADKSLLEDSLVLSSLYHLFTFQSLVADPTRLVACNIEPGRAELDSTDQLKTGSLVLLVSSSSTMLEVTQKLLAAKRGDELAIRAVLLSDETELLYMLKHADLIICDSPSKELVTANAGKTKVVPFQLYSQTTIDVIKDRISKWG